MNNTLLITGATSDIGFAYLKTLKHEPIKIIALYYDCEERLDELVKEYSIDIINVHLDLSDPKKVREEIIKISKHHQITQVLHLASPPVKQERFDRIPLETFENDFRVQVLSIAIILKVLIPQMKKKKYGKIVFMLTSCTIGVPPKFWSDYVTNKYALLGLMKSLAAEYAPHNIQINGLSPSMIETKFLTSMDERFIQMNADNNPLKRNVKIEEIIPAIKFLLSEQSSFITGTNTPITGGELF